MPHATPDPTQPAAATGFELAFALPCAWIAGVAALNRLQLDVWLRWQQSVAGNVRELYDEWACRFAGGAPIDG